MLFQFTLTIDSVDYSIAEPFRWESVEFSILRSQYHGIDFEFSEGDLRLDFTFMHEYQRIIDEYELEGSDADIKFLAEYREKESDSWLELFRGVLNLRDATWFDDRISCNVERIGFNNLVKTRFETKVDLLSSTTIDGTPLSGYAGDGTKSVTLHSRPTRFKSIQKAINHSRCFIRFAGAPVENDTITINGEDYIAKAAPTNNTNEFLIGADGVETAKNFIEIFNGSITSILRNDYRAMIARDDGDQEFLIITAKEAGSAFDTTTTDNAGNRIFTEDQGYGSPYEYVHTTVSPFYCPLELKDIRDDNDINENYNLWPEGFFYEVFESLAEIDTPNFLIIRNGSYSIKITADISATFNTTGDVYLDIYKSRNEQDLSTAVKLNPQNLCGRVYCNENTATFTNDLIDHTLSSINLNIGEYLFIVFVVVNDDVTTNIARLFVNEFQVEVFEDTVTEETPADVLLPHEAFSRCVSKITNQVTVASGSGSADSDTSDIGPVISEYFGRPNAEPIGYPVAGCGAYLSLTNGFMIRQADKTERTISASLKDLIDGYGSVHPIGFGFDDENGQETHIRIEEVDYFYNNIQIAQLDIISEHKFEVAKDKIYNELKFGYADWQSSLDNDIDEYNSLREWVTPAQKIKNRLEKVSTITGSGYLIEEARRNPFSDINQKGSDLDELLFFIQLDSTLTPRKVDPFEFVGNTKSDCIGCDDAYNLQILPTRNMMRFGKIINSGLYFKDGADTIKFVRGEGNYYIRTTLLNDSECDQGGDLNEIVLDENEDIQLNDIYDFGKLWIPEKHTFTAPMTADLLTNIRNNRYGYLRVKTEPGLITVDGYINVFILKATWKPVERVITFETIRKA